MRGRQLYKEATTVRVTVSAAEAEPALRVAREVGGSREATMIELKKGKYRSLCCEHIPNDENEW